MEAAAMSMEAFLKIREMGRQVKERRKAEDIDYAQMTAPCGLPCFECYLNLALFDRELAEAISGAFNMPVDILQCKGCRDEGGQCAHLETECRVYPCAQKKSLHTCAECDDFPCELLHPYADEAMKPHNTKVFSLCRIQKVGLEKWAREEAGNILDKYWYGTWTL
jgi:hypothetical protein